MDPHEQLHEYVDQLVAPDRGVPVERRPEGVASIPASTARVRAVMSPGACATAAIARVAASSAISSSAHAVPPRAPRR